MPPVVLIPEIRVCCGVFSLRAGSLIVAVFLCLMRLVLLILVAVLDNETKFGCGTSNLTCEDVNSTHPTENITSSDNETKSGCGTSYLHCEDVDFWTYVLLAFAVVYLIVGLILLAMVILAKYKFLICGWIIDVIVSIVVIIVYLIAVINVLTLRQKYEDLLELALIITAIFLVVVIELAYDYYIIYTYYKELRDLQRPIEQLQAAQASIKEKIEQHRKAQDPSVAPAMSTSTKRFIDL